MKVALLSQEARTGRRNLVGRRMVNTLLRAGGLISPSTGMFSTQMRQVKEMNLAGSSMSSKHGRLFTGVLNGIPVIVKIPKSDEARRGWKQEMTLTNTMAEAGIAPEVYVQSEHPHQFVIMKRYDMDLLNYLSDIIESNESPKSKVRRAGLVKRNLSLLIDRIVAHHATHPEDPVCFGDFRMENIVVNTQSGDLRQIDFDNAFCASKDDVKNVDLRLLLMLCVSFSYRDANRDVLSELFPPSGRVFMEELEEHREEVNSLLQLLRPLEEQQVRDRGRKGRYILNLRYLLTGHRENWTHAMLKMFPKRTSPVSVVADF